MKIHFDDWSTASVDSGFFLDLGCVPRVDETMCVSQSLVDRRFFEEGYFGDGENTLGSVDGNVWFTVVGVRHEVSEKGHLICIDIEFDNG